MRDWEVDYFSVLVSRMRDDVLMTSAQEITLQGRIL